MEENKKRERKEYDDELEEEAKMEKFYSLLRSFRDARDRRRKELQEELEKNESSNKKMKKTTTTTTANNNNNHHPEAEVSFQREDFTTEIQFRRPPLIFPSPIIPRDADSKGKKKEQHHVDHALDLKLSL